MHFTNLRKNVRAVFRNCRRIVRTFFKNCRQILRAIFKNSPEISLQFFGNSLKISLQFFKIRLQIGMNFCCNSPKIAGSGDNTTPMQIRNPIGYEFASACCNWGDYTADERCSPLHTDTHTLQGRFATGRCGHRPLRNRCRAGSYGSRTRHTGTHRLHNTCAARLAAVVSGHYRVRCSPYTGTCGCYGVVGMRISRRKRLSSVRTLMLPLYFCTMWRIESMPKPWYWRSALVVTGRPLESLTGWPR